MVHGVLNVSVMHLSSLRLGLASLVLVCGLTSTVGCTISAPPVQESNDPTSPAPSSTGSGSSVAHDPLPATSGAPDAGAATTTTTTTTTTTSDAGSVGTGVPVTPLAQCNAGSASEVESNDTPATANSFGAATTFCGTVSLGDVDYATFTLPANATGFSYSVAWGNDKGAPAISISAGGVTAAAGQEPPLFPGQLYTFKVVGTGAATSYALAIAIH
jgi:hypothetical protein